MRTAAWTKRGAMVATLLALAACGKADEAPVGKSALAEGPKADVAAVAAADLPAGVRAAVLAKVPGMSIAEAERKERDGMIFYDVEGTRGDDAAVELDLIEEQGGYRVVEVQRDIAWSAAPAAVRAAAEAAPDSFAPARVIESTQADGTVIFELFAPGRSDEPAVEVDWEDGEAAVRRERNAY